MSVPPDLAAEKSANSSFAGRNAAAETRIGVTGACISALQDCNAELLAYIAALSDYFLPEQSDNASLRVCNAPSRPFVGSTRGSGGILQDNNEPARALSAALQARSATMLPCFLPLQATGEPMQASAAAMQDCEARGCSPFFPIQNNPKMEVNKNGIRQSSR
jgi:hypothetical protein